MISFTVKAGATEDVSTDVLAVAGGIGAGAGNESYATVGGAVDASIGADAKVTTPAISVTATDTPEASATAIGVAVGIGAGVGVSDAEATTATTVAASVGGGAKLAGGTLTVSATRALPAGGVPSTYASSSGGSGGILFGYNGSSASASAGGSVTASTGASVQLPAGSVAVLASSSTLQQAVASGIAVGGILGIGLVSASASSGLPVKAELGGGATTDLGRTGTLAVSALGTDANEASATSGGGGLISGDGANASTSDSSTATTLVDDSTLYAGAVGFLAAHESDYEAHVDGTQAALIGQSGAEATSTVATGASVTVAAGAMVYASGSAILSAQSTFTQTNELGSENAAGGAGGGIAINSSSSRTTITGSTTIDVGQGATVAVQGDGTTGLNLIAGAQLTHDDTADLTTGGAITNPSVSSSVGATLTNSVTAEQNAILSATGNLDLATYATATAEANAEVSTYGLAAIGKSTATVALSAIQSVTVGQGAKLSALGSVDITAGEDTENGLVTALTSLANAKGYVRGLIAVPDAEAHALDSSSATVTLVSGSSVTAGQNVVLKASPGSVTPETDGVGHGYELGFIPADATNNFPSSTTSSTMTIDGSVVAGAYDTLSITIPDCGDAPPFCKSMTVASGGAPFSAEYIPDFDPGAYNAAHFAGTDAQVLASGVSSTPVGAVSLSGLYAAGGSVTIDADTLSGIGSVTANGGPQITVDNESPDYLLVDGALIPDNTGGAVTFTGAAKGAPHLTVSTLRSNQTGVITIENLYGSTVGSPASDGKSYGPAMFLSGDISNVSGELDITNLKGSLGSIATIDVPTQNTLVPAGVVALSYDVYRADGAPYFDWENAMLWPGGSWVSPNADVAASTAATLLEQRNTGVTYTDPYALTDALIGYAGSYQNYSFVFYGSCVAYVNVADCSYGAATSWSTDGGAIPISNAANCADDQCNNWRWYPLVHPELLGTSAGDGSITQPANGGCCQIYGNVVSIQANIIDINGGIDVGSSLNWSVWLPSNTTVSATVPVQCGPYDIGCLLDQGFYELTHGGQPETTTVQYTLNQYRTAYIAGQVPRDATIAMGTLAGGDNRINATYDAFTDQITLDDTLAVAGSSYVKLDGKIISTDPLGSVHVDEGFGSIRVENDTGKALVVGSMNTGTGSAVAPSEVEIVDRNLPDTGHWLYINTPGAGTDTYQGSDSADAQTVEATGLYHHYAEGTPVDYQPETGMRWQWVLVASISRVVNIDPSTDKGSVGHWVFNGNQINPWSYVVPGTSQTQDWSHPTGQLLYNQPAGLAFQQTISFGTLPDGANIDVKDILYGYGSCGTTQYSCNYDFTPFDYPQGTFGWWEYYFVTAAALKMTMSADASYQIGISFGGYSQGTVSINSNGPVILTHDIVNPSGTTTIVAPSITESSGTTITIDTAALVLDAYASPLDRGLTVKLEGPQTLQVTASGGISLFIDSGATVTSLNAGGGDIGITTTGSLVAGQAPSGYHVVGRNVSIWSEFGSVGSPSAPLILNTTGTLSIDATGDIGLDERSSADLLVDHLTSIGGDVWLSARGAVYDVHLRTSAQVLSNDQIQAVWQNLHLTADTGATDNAASSVAAFESLVELKYQQYWQLLDSGAVVDSSYVLGDKSIDLFRAQAAAALGVQDPTDAKVRSFAAG
ncbi:MAG: beta strand repeat-containing protein, partial [Gaiellaceae bacterium]